MLPVNHMTKLEKYAETQIKQTLLSRGASAPKDEIQDLKDFLFDAVPKIAVDWRKEVPRQYRMQVSSVFCHQTPRVRYQQDTPGYGFRSSLPAKNRVNGADGWGCELADLLIVMEVGLRGNPWTLRQAGLVQAKAGRHPLHRLGNPDEYKQHHLLSCWPEFTLGAKFRSGPRRLKGLTPGAACYGLIDQPSGTWTIHRPQQSAPLLGPKQGFAHWLAELATGQDGAPADILFGRPNNSLRHAVPRDWPRLVDELLRVTGQKTIAGKRKRGASHVVRMLDLATGLENEADRTDRPTDWIRMAETGGRGGQPDSHDTPLGEGRGIGVLHIRFEPAEG
jgi:hypothetical protein